MFPPFCLTWGQTMVEVTKIMVTSFKRSHACTAALCAPNPAAGYHWPMPPPETPGHSWASLGQSLVESLLLSPRSWGAQGFVCAFQVSVSPVLCKIWQLCGGVNGDLLQEGLCLPRLTAPTAPAPAAGHCCLHRRHSDTVLVSRCGVSEPWCTQVCLSPLSVSGG